MNNPANKYYQLFYFGQSGILYDLHILDKDLAITIESQLRDLSQNSRDSLKRLGTQLKEELCKKNTKGQKDRNDAVDSSSLLKSLETKSFKGNFSDKFYDCENGTINVVSGDYSVIFDKELGSQILISGASNEDKYVSDDHLMGRSLGGYIKRTNISRSSGDGKITGLGANFGFYEALKINDWISLLFARSVTRVTIRKISFLYRSFFT